MSKSLKTINENLARAEFGEDCQITFQGKHICGAWGENNYYRKLPYTSSFDSQIPLLEKYSVNVKIISTHSKRWQACIGKLCYPAGTLPESSARALEAELVNMGVIE